jgi:putative phosphoribosyl transferase
MKRLPFRDRREAGQRLAAMLTAYAKRHDVLVLALPRGGVPVAFEVARALDTPLDVFLVRKLGVPGHEELAMGAMVSGAYACSMKSSCAPCLSPTTFAAVATREQQELARRERLYRSHLGDARRPRWERAAS